MGNERELDGRESAALRELASDALAWIGDDPQDDPQDDAAEEAAIFLIDVEAGLTTGTSEEWANTLRTLEEAAGGAMDGAASEAALSLEQPKAPPEEDTPITSDNWGGLITLEELGMMMSKRVEEPAPAGEKFSGEDDGPERLTPEQRIENYMQQRGIDDPAQAPIAVMDLSSRAYNALKDVKIDRIEQLQLLDDKQLLGIRNFGQNSLKEVNEFMDRFDEIENRLLVKFTPEGTDEQQAALGRCLDMNRMHSMEDMETLRTWTFHLSMDAYTDGSRSASGQLLQLSEYYGGLDNKHFYWPRDTWKDVGRKMNDGPTKSTIDQALAPDFG